MKKDNINNLLITTPIFYPNGDPHVGTITTAIICDFLNRAFKIIDYDTRFLTGTDEHGQKVLNKANSMDLEPQEYVDQVAVNFQDIFKKFSIDYDIFYRTTSIKHQKQVQEIWNILLEKDLIYQSTYSGWYSESQETFVDNKEQYDDCKFITEQVFFFKMSTFEKKIKDLLINNNFLVPSNRAHELLGFMKNGLKDLCISREKLTWGIKIPNRDSGVIYVWLDALTNYINSCGFPQTDKYWDNVIHVVGKDICIFHGIYWICLLLALDKYPENLKLLVHNWWVVSGKKASKSLGNVVDPKQLLSIYPANAIRFYILYYNLINSDNEFDSNEIIPLYNTFLVNKVSNLIYRVVHIAKKNQLKIPFDNIYKNEFYYAMKENITKVNINGYLKCLFDKADELNKFIDKNKLWENTDLLKNIQEDIINVYGFLKPITPDLGSVDNMLFKKIR